MKRAHHTHNLLMTSAILLALSPSFAQALPTGGSVSSGTATISNPSSTLTVINQSTPKAVVNWTGFNVGAGQEVSFQDQQGSNSITLNRVSGTTPMGINGTVVSNGNVWFINPAGILIGSSGKVNAAGFLATTSQITDPNFMAGNYGFTPGGGPAGATIQNAGTITIAENGLAALVGPNVTNTGTINFTGNIINAKVGTIALASGDTFTVDLTGDGLINLAATSVGQQSITNTGTLNAIGAGGGGTVAITAAQANVLVDSLINLNGLVEANNLTVNNSGGDVQYGAKFAGSTGGNVTLSALRNISIEPNVQIAPSSGKLNVTLDANNGNLASGSIYMAPGSLINSNGGNIILGGGLNLSPPYGVTGPLTGYAVGDNAPGKDEMGNAMFGEGIFLDGASLKANGGNITLNGAGVISTAQTNSIGVEGVYMNFNCSTANNCTFPSLTTTGTGTITINGATQVASGNDFEVQSVATDIQQATIQTQSGGITISGNGGGNSQDSIGTELLIDNISSNAGYISVSGTTGNSMLANNQGVYMVDGKMSTNTGGIEISGFTGNGGGYINQGVYTYGQQIATNTGSIFIQGSTYDTAPDSTIGVYLDSGTKITSTGKGTGLSINIDGTGTFLGVYADNAAISTVDANAYVIGNGPTLNAAVELMDSQFTSTGKGELSIIRQLNSVQ